MKRYNPFIKFLWQGWGRCYSKNVRIEYKRSCKNLIIEYKLVFLLLTQIISIL